MTHLQDHEFAFFLRLRDYDGEQPIEKHFVDRLSRAGMPQPDAEFELQIITVGTLIILDGLDEVRPAYREAIYKRINQFYATYFSGSWDRSHLIATCRKEAYRAIPLDIPQIWEVRPLTDEQIRLFATNWPLGYPTGKSAESFVADLETTPKILELARSPLLLVGGLMQYSESNLGIPEERFQYLQRIGGWLVSDWAAAQGLPPDPLRPIYERVLPRFAIEMHDRGVTDLKVETAITLLEEWLPQYGASESDAVAVLDGVFTRTGILVRDIPGGIVFAQFSLQEYFASTILAKSSRLTSVIGNELGAWWREAVLLSIAQLDDPSTALTALFGSDPTAAAEAVAECPTPPLAIQDRAIDACVAAIDSGDGAAHRATVALLRKIAVAPEFRLISELTVRLRNAGDIGSTVGLILAHAGTNAATQLLAAHPEVWERCLKSAGYLSSNLESMLVQIIIHGADAYADRAAEILVPRVSRDRKRELLGILQSLNEPRAAKLASLLLREIEAGASEPEDYDVSIQDIALCSVKIPKFTDLPARRDGSMRRFPPTLGEIGVVVASLNQILRPSRVAAILEQGLRWPHERRSLGIALGASLATLAGGLSPTVGARVFAVAAISVVLSGLLSERAYGPRMMEHPLVRYRQAWVPSAMLAAAVIALALASPATPQLQIIATRHSTGAAIVFAMGAMGTIVGYLRVDGWRRLPWYRRAEVVLSLTWLCANCTAFLALKNTPRFPLVALTITGAIGAIAVVLALFAAARDAYLFNEASEIASDSYVP